MCPRVLFVDNDRDTVAGVEIRLRAAGYSTLAAYDGEEGVTAAIRYMPDVILLDLRMPTMGGVAALKDLKHHPSTRDIPIVVLTACLKGQQEALEAGALFVIQKPYSAEGLLAAIAAAIDGPRPVTA